MSDLVRSQIDRESDVDAERFRGLSPSLVRAIRESEAKQREASLAVWAAKQQEQRDQERAAEAVRAAKLSPDPDPNISPIVGALKEVIALIEDSRDTSVYLPAAAAERNRIASASLQRLRGYAKLLDGKS